MKGSPVGGAQIFFSISPNLVSGSVGVGVCFAFGGVVLIPFLPCQLLKMRHFPLIDYLMICIIWFNAACKCLVSRGATTKT